MPLPAYADEAAPEQLSDGQSNASALTLSGSGTADDPYQIATAQDLAEFRDAVNAGNNGICAQLTDDITLSGEWAPIGTNDYYYTGTFDGANHTVSGLSVTQAPDDSGFFADLGDGCVVKNLKVEGTVSTSKQYAGGIAGFAQKVIISNCSFAGSVSSTSSKGRVAGIVGGATSDPVSFSGCANKASVSGRNAGGILGFSNQSCSFMNCYNTGAIAGTSRAGGIVGQTGKSNVDSYFSSCFNVGEISETADNRAGIAAWHNGTVSSSSVSNCFYTKPTASNAGGTNPVSGTFVELVSAADLGAAFVEGDNYPTLAWENVVATPKATVVFSITPEDAQLTINGKVSSATSKRDADTYSYEVSKAGYVAAAGEFTVTAEQAAASQTVSLVVELQAKELTSITVAGTAAQYYVGDEQPALTVTAHYADGTSEGVTDFTTDWDSSAEATGKVVTVTYNGKIATFTCDFVVKPGPAAALAGKADVNLKEGSYGFEEVELDGNTVLVSTNKGVGASSSTMTITMKAAGMLSFDWKVSSEAGYDWLDIKVNGNSTTTNKSSRSGVIDWTAFSTLVSAGDVVSINYTKDSSGDRNDDTAWVKNFALTPAYAITLTTVPADAKLVLKNAAGQELTAKNGAYTVMAGTYSYEASAFGYETATGTIDVTDADVAREITLTAMPRQTVSFNVAAPEGLSAADATIVVKTGKQTLEPQTDGTYSLPAGDYTYTITHPNCDDASGTFTVSDSAVTVPVTLERKWVIGDYFTAAGVAVTAENGGYGFVLDDNDSSLLKSENQGKGSSSAVLTLTAQQAGQLSFSYKVSTEANYDKFNVTVNGNSLVKDASGLVDWTTASATVAAGDKVLFTYSKDYSGNNNDDTVWLKDFSLAPAYGVTITATPADATIVLRNAAGEALTGNAGVFTAIPGEYSYEVSAFGYGTKTGTITVTDQDVAQAVVLDVLPTQAVTFTTTLPEGMSCTPAVTVKSADGVERAYAAGLPAGEYTYVATAEGCDAVEGTFTVADAAVTIPVAFVRTLVMTDFVDSELATLANDTIRPFKGIYDEAGNYLYSSLSSYETAKLALTANANVRVSFDYDADNDCAYSYGFLIEKGDVTLKNTQGTNDWQTFTADLSAGDTLYLNHYIGYNRTGTVKVKNFVLTPLHTVTTSIPSGATIELYNNGELIASNLTGSYVVPDGTYTYTVSQFGYTSQQGQVTVAGADAAITVDALAPVESKTITFDVPEGATVTVNHATAGQMTAQENGTYVLPVGASFTYVVSKDNYLPQSGSFTVSDDATISVTLEFAGEAWDGTTKTEPSLVEGVYQISNAAELAWFADKVSEDNTVNAVLTSQINLGGKTWTSMGKLNETSYQNEFAGTFDGAGHTVSGLKASNGLFAATSVTAVVKNLAVSGEIQGSSNIGGIVGTNAGLIENCLFKGSVKNGSSYSTGGIAGRCSQGTGIIRNCVNEGEISYVGNLYSMTSVNLGGIVGYTYGEVSNCYNVGSLSAHATYAKGMGGIVGSLRSSTLSGSGSIVNCYNAGTMTKYAAAGALAGVLDGMASVTNSYYLNSCGATDERAQAKTADEMKAHAFVGALNGSDGTAWRIDSDAINGGFPVLAWQGGQEYNNQDAKDVAAAVAALKLQAVANGETVDLTAGTNGAYSLEPDQAAALVLPAAGAQDTAISWAIAAVGDTNESAIAADGTLTYPTAGTATYTLTATITKGDASAAVSFTVELLSAAQVNENALSALCTKMQGRSIWAFQVKNPDTTTARDAVVDYLTSQGIDLDQEGITLTFVNPGTKAFPGTDTVNLADDGTISYFQGIEGNASAKYAQYDNVTFNIERGGATKQFGVRLFIGWERATVQDILNAAALSVTWDSIKPEGVNNQVEYEDANGEAVPGEPVFPLWTLACDGTDVETGEANAANVAVPDKTVLMLPATVGTASVAWEATYDENAGQLVTFEDVYVDGKYMCKATLNGSAYGEYEVSLDATFTYNLFNDGEGVDVSYIYQENPDTHLSEPVLDEEGNPITIDVPLVTTYAGISFVLAQGEKTPIDAAQTQSDLENKYEDLIRDFVDKDKKPDLANVTDDLQMPTPSTLEQSGIFQDRDFEKVTMTSGDTEHLTFYGYHAQIYRPLPGEEAVTVPYTVTITDRITDEVYAEKTFTLTVAPFEQKELDDALALMARVATSDVYWNGLAYEGADKNNITQSLKPFSEIVADVEGNLTYIRGALNITFDGIELDDLPGYDPMIYGQSWREIRSSNENVIASETLRFTQPEYNTEVTLDSVMSYTKYAKYWEKFGIGDEATEGSALKYEAFKGFYKVPVNTTVKVAGTKGDTPIEPAPDVNVTVTVSLSGVLGTTAQNTVAAALPVVAKDLNVDGKVTYDEAMVAAHQAYAKNGADDFAITASGWVSKLWGVSTESSGFLRNGAATPDVISRITVEPNDVLYVYTYKDSANYSDLVTSFNVTSQNVSANQAFDITLNYSGYDSNFNAITGTVSGAQIGYATPEGFVPLEGCVTAAGGKASVTFAKPGTYVLTAQSDSKIMTAPYCIVTVEYTPSFTVGSQPFAGDYVKVTLGAGFDEATTPVAAGVSFLKLADGTYAALMTANEAAALTADSFTFAEGAAASAGVVGDVNNSGRMNIVDAQIAYDLGNNKYADFSVLPMAGWFAADMNADGVVDATDAFAIQYAVHYGRA